MGIHTHARYTDAEALAAAIAGGLSKVIWKDASERALTDEDRTELLGWTDLDLTAYTSANALFAIVQLLLIAKISGSAGMSIIQFRKNGTTPTYTPMLIIQYTQPNWTYSTLIAIVGLDSGQVLEYRLSPATDATIHSYLDILGYIE